MDIVQVLRSEEGRALRARHQENVCYLRGKLLQAGLPVVDTPSHIIPVHVGSLSHCSHHLACLHSYYTAERILRKFSLLRPRTNPQA